ncbi:thymidine phosphorylase [Desulfonispora thiosulfatigenes DSM 11270]|uniref:Pyrimidine-nucleoside phosphorylase n=1 Tax=Desulfonispora thiosulfatigenes DSM 11270 TaxID=656914 RepID=A0A1W1V2A2_DESTI|nr:pyrimidine-nucleoside phosphorylase [Desulfonispora thiosulfatigenes]SMB87416.1 thymidine phosphorylase [Desulfonispora thiosulfatigenes DSM 11270]
MRMVDLIEKKRDGLSLTKAEIDFIIQGFTSGEIPDYQVSAFLMAVYFKDMTKKERAHFTMAMVETGDQVNLSDIEGIKVDKHSTGGVGDTTTLILAPLVASLGIPVAKMSGRGLGHTGGTIDKLESIPGFNVELEQEKFIELINNNKIALVGQTGNLTPADKRFYALRDVTATVPSIPLIASSIMSKKIASGADAIVLDVKVGSGAFMKNIEDAKSLARAMVEIGDEVGRKTIAVISDMNQPLGYAIGNSLEVKEAIDTLKGKGPKDLYELCLNLGSQMLILANKAQNIEEAYTMLEDAINTGKALEKFKTFITAQGGDSQVVDNPSKLPEAKYQTEVKSREKGYVNEIKSDKIGIVASILGAGRKTKDSIIDLAVGIILHKKIGDQVQKGEVLATIHSNQENVNQAIDMIYDSYNFNLKPVNPPPLIIDVIKE